jgi:hypothetical protein
MVEEMLTERARGPELDLALALHRGCQYSSRQWFGLTRLTRCSAPRAASPRGASIRSSSS